MTVSLYNCGHCKLPQLVGQQCHCRTPEDEAFDDLARRQGMWGGGFQAKKAMAADKMQEPDALTVAYQSGFFDGKKAALAGREWNFCERCGKRTADLTVIHTCTPPQGDA
jgi:hypothetical protein